MVYVAFCICAVSAQIQNHYSFVPATGTYLEITGTPQVAAQGDDIVSSAIDIGFSFMYGSNTYFQIKIYSNGYINFRDNASANQFQ